MINQIEENHFELSLFSDEWNELKNSKSRYVEQGTVEQVIPLLFAFIYLLLAFYVGAGS